MTVRGQWLIIDLVGLTGRSADLINTEHAVVLFFWHLQFRALPPSHGITVSLVKFYVIRMYVHVSEINTLYL